MCFEYESVLSRRAGLCPKRASAAGTAPSRAYPVEPHDAFILSKAFLKFSVTDRQMTVCFVVRNAGSVCGKYKFFADGYFYRKYGAVIHGSLYKKITRGQDLHGTARRTRDALCRILKIIKKVQNHRGGNQTDNFLVLRTFLKTLG